MKRAFRILLTQPSLIQSLLPSVCPSNSVIPNISGEYPKSMNLTGLCQREWNDQLSCTIHPKVQAYRMAYCLKRFAIGSSDDTVRIYKDAICQEHSQLTYGEAVRHVGPTSSGSLSFAAGNERIKIWDLVTSTLLGKPSSPLMIFQILGSMALGQFSW